MRYRSKEKIHWLEFEILKGVPGLVHGVFLRHGGVSTAPYGSLNAGGNTGDDSEAVALNRGKIAQILGLKNLVSVHQCHGADIVWAPLSTPDSPADGIVTRTPGLGLMIKHADCQAAFLYDPIQRVVAAIHCGWRGNVQNIYGRAVDMLVREAGSCPQDLLACIGPSLGPQASEFKNFKEEFPESLWRFQIAPGFFDLWEMSRRQLIDAGVRSEHIEIAKVCTYSAPGDYYSYRRNKVTGRHATVVALIPFVTNKHTKGAVDFAEDLSLERDGNLNKLSRGSTTARK